MAFLGFGKGTDAGLGGTQVKLDALAVGVIEPDVFLLAVGVDADAAVLDAGVVELAFDGFEVGPGADGEGEVVEAEVVLIECGGLGLVDQGEEEAGVADEEDDEVVGEGGGRAKQRDVEGCGARDVGDAEDEVVEGLRGEDGGLLRTAGKRLTPR